MSSIFKWYGEDFIEQYTPVVPGSRDARERAILGAIVKYGTHAASERARTGRPAIRYIPYDWSLNDIERRGVPTMFKSIVNPSVLPIAAVMIVAVGAVPAGQRDPDDNTLHVVLPRDAIPAIFKPVFEPASEADLADHELVIGVVGEREQRAYSTWQLDRHEIVNDTFEGRPIAVTW